MVPEPATPEAETRLGLAHRVLIQGTGDAPLVVLVHGRAGTSSVMWAFRRAIPAAWNIVAVQAPIPDPIGGFSWWLVDAPGTMEQRASEGAGKMRAFLDRVCTYYALRPRQLFGLGFSQGGALLSYIVQDSPQLFVGIGLLASFVVERSDIQAHPIAGAPQVFIAHGSDDPVVPLDRSTAGISYLEARGFIVERHVDPVAHKVGSNGMRALPSWLTRLGEGV